MVATTITSVVRDTGVPRALLDPCVSAAVAQGSTRRGPEVYNRGMNSVESGLVAIVREFLTAHRSMKRIFDRHRSGELRFREVHELVGDSAESLLFRLKERCHALFRPGEHPSSVVMRREALFDLAIGSLFHETMKFRENLYQLEIYAPKVRALRSEAGQEADQLFREFEKILGAASVRLDETLQETETLLAQTRDQFRLLLIDHRSNGLINRYLVEHRDLIEEMFDDGLDALLREMHGDPATGYSVAAHSYLVSGYFAEANRLLSQALARGGERERLLRLANYARGMEAYLARDYREAVKRLGAWLDAGPDAEEEHFADLAFTAVSRVGQLVGSDGGEAVVADAAELVRKLGPLSPRARAELASS